MNLHNTPFLASHVNGDVAWVDVLFVPQSQRRQGFGRRMFSEWAAKLPETIKKIELLAVDLDGGSPIGFWRKLGFEPEETYFPELMTGCYMVQALRGGVPVEPTPKQDEPRDRSADDVWCYPA